MIHSSIGYRIEGVEPVELSSSTESKEEQKEEQTDSNSSKIAEKETELPNLLEGVFDLSDKDNDYLFYKDQIMNKGSHVNFFMQ